MARASVQWQYFGGLDSRSERVKKFNMHTSYAVLFSARTWKRKRLLTFTAMTINIIKIISAIVVLVICTAALNSGCWDYFLIRTESVLLKILVAVSRNGCWDYLLTRTESTLIKAFVEALSSGCWVLERGWSPHWSKLLLKIIKFCLEIREKL